MKNPLDGELQSLALTFDPKKRYRYTWPGQPPAMISGADLTELCKGANPLLLNIEETGDTERSERIASPAKGDYK